MQKVTLAWCLKANGVRIYKSHWADVAGWWKRLPNHHSPKGLKDSDDLSLYRGMDRECI